jgi:hypothetical protein
MDDYDFCQWLIKTLILYYVVPARSVNVFLNEMIVNKPYAKLDTFIGGK